MTQDSYSRKELTGWGDVQDEYHHSIKVQPLPNRINHELEKAYSKDIAEVIDILLTGLHLEEYKVRQKKYKADKEDTVLVEVPLSDILMKRAMKKLTNILN